MDLFDALHTRRSIRQFTDKPVPEDLVQKILSAAMAAPSACNAQPWHYVIISDPQVLKQIPQVNPHAAMAASAPLAILVCGDLDLEISPGFWVVDCSAAVQNLLLAAHALGLGAVWTGIYPRDERSKAFQKMFSLPPTVMPHSLVVLGWPAEHPASDDRYRPDRCHRNRW